MMTFMVHSTNGCDAGNNGSHRGAGAMGLAATANEQRPARALPRRDYLLAAAQEMGGPRHSKGR
jgi:hypothetical protein